MTEILVTGGSGLVGSRFLELSRYKDKIAAPTSDRLDLTSKTALEDFFGKNSPKWVVNFAAYTNVSEGEKERNNQDGACWRVNVEATRNLCEVIKPSGAKRIQISTDMVFPGTKENPGPYSEKSVPETDSDKLTWYGYTKVEGERVVKETLGENGIILRIIYPVRAKYPPKLDYLRKPLSLYDQGKLYPLFNDQQVCISFIDEISLTLDRIIASDSGGVFHCSSANTTTPYEIVSYLLEKARGVKDVVQASSLKELLANGGSVVRYPLFGGLKGEETERNLEIKFSSWQEIVDKLVEQKIEA